MCRALKASEIDVRLQSQTDKGIILLLYKNARVDMDILDEEYGKLGWQRTHTFKDGKLYCTVSVWDKEKQMWISREDVGTESNTEAEKGQASDSFKRANVNFGIGRELYTSPFIWVPAGNYSVNAKGKTTDKFSVEGIDIKDKQIIGLSIKNDNTGKVVFTYGTLKDPRTAAPKPPKQAPTKTENEPKTVENEPKMTVEEASKFKIDHETIHTGELLGDVWKHDFASIPNLYETGSTDLRWAIDTLNKAIKQSKANEKRKRENKNENH